MIARDILTFLLLVILPFLFIDLRFFRRKKAWWKRVLWWIICAAMVGYTVYLAMERDFIPGNDRILILYGYLFLLGLVIIPMWTFSICSLLGKACSWIVRKCKKHPKAKPHNYGNLMGTLSVPAVWFVLFWGTFVGFNKLEVNHQTYVSEKVPEAFDGYRIVLFSDAHVGSYQKHNSWLLQRAVDSINAQKPDIILFVGDLQNIQPTELYPHIDVLEKLKAKDGVYSVLGNHDYAEYIGADEAMKVANCRETVSLERQMGWNVLLNEHGTIEHGKDHMILAGMENDGDGKRFPQKGDVDKTLENVTSDDFILMMEHDPSAWRRKIVTDGRAQLTLSGHTHKMQFSIFGWCPLSLTGKEYNGWYKEGDQQLFVTAGLGGLIPFRFGATGEIVVLTLKRE
jgi:predicted MPP superfamily phosphohydrolase